MLEQYTPLLGQYLNLWIKYGSGHNSSPGALAAPMIASQEEAISWSLKLRAFFEDKVKELHKPISADKLRRLFIIASQLVPKCERNNDTFLFDALSIAYATFTPDYDKMARIDIDKYGLHFDFGSVEDLFLSDESDLNSVITFE